MSSTPGAGFGGVVSAGGLLLRRARASAAFPSHHSSVSRCPVVEWPETVAPQLRPVEKRCSAGMKAAAREELSKTNVAYLEFISVNDTIVVYVDGIEKRLHA